MLAFTGQGAFRSGIAKDLFNDFPYFRSQIQQLDKIVQRLGFPSVVPIVDGSIEDGSIEDDSSTHLEQLSTVVVEIALTRFWLLLGIKPSAVIGHSLGEYAALVAAGVVSAADAIFLAGKRAQLIGELCEKRSHAMLAVRAREEDIKRLAADTTKYEVSCGERPRGHGHQWVQRKHRTPSVASWRRRA